MIRTTVMQLLRTLREVGRDLLTAPASWRGRGWALAAASGVVVGVAYLEKRPLQALLQRSPGGPEPWLATFANVAGSGFSLAALGLVTLGVGLWARWPDVVAMARALAVGGLWCWIFVEVGQLVLAERRPIEGGAMRFFALHGHGVSGHAAAAALLYFPAREIFARRASAGGRRILGAALIVWAVFIGGSRVWSGMHYVWNVVLGLSIGGFVGWVTTRRLSA